MSVPSFFIYGEPDKPLDLGFLHVETVMERRQVHNGRVDAHKHNRMAQITLWIRGQGTYFIEDKKLDFIAPAVSFVPSGTVHGFTVEPEASDALVASVANSALPQLQALSVLDFGKPVMVRGQPKNRLWTSLRSCMDRLFDDYQRGEPAALGGLLAVVASDIASLSSAGFLPVPDANSLAQTFRGVVDRHFWENLTIEGYVGMLGTTRHLLEKACRNTYGLSIKAYIDERRLLEAKRLLLFTVRSVEDICYETGFHDPAYFSRFFRQKTGAPPGAWRKEQQG